MHHLWSCFKFVVLPNRGAECESGHVYYQEDVVPWILGERWTEPGMMYFHTKWGAKEPQNPPNQRVGREFELSINPKINVAAWWTWIFVHSEQTLVSPVKMGLCFQMDRSPQKRWVSCQSTKEELSDILRRNAHLYNLQFNPFSKKSLLVTFFFGRWYYRWEVETRFQVAACWLEPWKFGANKNPRWVSGWILECYVGSRFVFFGSSLMLNMLPLFFCWSSISWSH